MDNGAPGNTAKEEYLRGLRGGIPVALGYLSVSFAFGVAAVQTGMPAAVALIISMTNMTSAGQLAGLTLIAAAGSFLEMAVTQFVINIRYSLMSILLSQKLDSSVTSADRFLMSFGMTDEIFAIAAGQIFPVRSSFFYGLMTLPYICWSLGTFLGASSGSILPQSVLSALGIAIYGMFIAIIIPPSKASRAVAEVVILAVLLSCCFRWLPALREISSGFAVVICAVAAAGAGALLHPMEPQAEGEREDG